MGFSLRPTTLIVNAILGLATLFLVDYLDLMAIDIGVLEFIVTLLFGIPGALLVMLLTFLGLI